MDLFRRDYIIDVSGRKKMSEFSSEEELKSEYARLLDIPDNLGGIYFLYGNETVFYIGRSENVKNRVSLHLSKLTHIDPNYIEKISRVEIIIVDGKELQEKIEGDAIRKYKPLLNKQKKVSNATTFREYLKTKHIEYYGIAYVQRSIAMEAKMIRNMLDEHGEEITKSFIDRCFAEYKPTPQYPSLNFAFMYSFMRERVLPKILAEKARLERMVQMEAEMSTEEIRDWL